MADKTKRTTAERRQIARQKSLLRGTVYFNNRRSALDCLIRDMTRYGARLVFPDAVTTPDVVDLFIPQKERTLRAHIIWRHGNEIGIVFAQAVLLTQSPEQGDLAGRVARLELDVADLKRALKKLKAYAGSERDVA
jgi:hypothetical protein